MAEELVRKVRIVGEYDPPDLRPVINSFKKLEEQIGSITKDTQYATMALNAMVSTSTRVKDIYKGKGVKGGSSGEIIKNAFNELKDAQEIWLDAFNDEFRKQHEKYGRYYSATIGKTPHKTLRFVDKLTEKQYKLTSEQRKEVDLARAGKGTLPKDSTYIQEILLEHGSFVGHMRENILKGITVTTLDLIDEFEENADRIDKMVEKKKTVSRYWKPFIDLMRKATGQILDPAETAITSQQALEESLIPVKEMPKPKITSSIKVEQWQEEQRGYIQNILDDMERLYNILIPKGAGKQEISREALSQAEYGMESFETLQDLDPHHIQKAYSSYIQSIQHYGPEWYPWRYAKNQQKDLSKVADLSIERLVVATANAMDKVTGEVFKPEDMQVHHVRSIRTQFWEKNIRRLPHRIFEWLAEVTDIKQVEGHLKKGEKSLQGMPGIYTSAVWHHPANLWGMSKLSHAHYMHGHMEKPMDLLTAQGEIPVLPELEGDYMKKAYGIIREDMEKWQQTYDDYIYEQAEAFRTIPHLDPSEYAYFISDALGVSIDEAEKRLKEAGVNVFQVNELGQKIFKGLSVEDYMDMWVANYLDMPIEVAKQLRETSDDYQLVFQQAEKAIDKAVEKELDKVSNKLENALKVRNIGLKSKGQKEYEKVVSANRAIIDAVFEQQGETFDTMVAVLDQQGEVMIDADNFILTTTKQSKEASKLAKKLVVAGRDIPTEDIKVKGIQEAQQTIVDTVSSYRKVLPKIAYDLDGVLASENMGRLIELDKIKESDPEKWFELLKEHFATQVPMLSEDYFEGIDSVVITAREKALQAVTENWLKIHYGEKAPKVRIVGYSATSAQDKANAMAEEGVELLIDNNLKWVKAVQETGLEAIHWNEDIESFMKPLSESGMLRKKLADKLQISPEDIDENWREITKQIFEDQVEQAGDVLSWLRENYGKGMAIVKAGIQDSGVSTMALLEDIVKGVFPKELVGEGRDINKEIDKYQGLIAEQYEESILENYDRLIAAYEYTQRTLRELHPSGVIELYRGTTDKHYKKELDELAAKGEALFRMPTLTRYTTDKDIAERFAKFNKSVDKGIKDLVVKQLVPIEKIFMSYKSWPSPEKYGNYDNEEEFIVFGGLEKLRRENVEYDFPEVSRPPEPPDLPKLPDAEKFYPIVEYDKFKQQYDEWWKNLWGKLEDVGKPSPKWGGSTLVGLTPLAREAMIIRGSDEAIEERAKAWEMEVADTTQVLDTIIQRELAKIGKSPVWKRPSGIERETDSYAKVWEKWLTDRPTTFISGFEWDIYGSIKEQERKLRTAAAEETKLPKAMEAIKAMALNMQQRWKDLDLTKSFEIISRLPEAVENEIGRLQTGDPERYAGRANEKRVLEEAYLNVWTHLIDARLGPLHEELGELTDESLKKVKANMQRFLTTTQGEARPVDIIDMIKDIQKSTPYLEESLREQYPRLPEKELEKAYQNIFDPGNTVKMLTSIITDTIDFEDWVRGIGKLSPLLEEALYKTTEESIAESIEASGAVSFDEEKLKSFLAESRKKTPESYRKLFKGIFEPMQLTEYTTQGFRRLGLGEQLDPEELKKLQAAFKSLSKTQKESALKTAGMELIQLWSGKNTRNILKQMGVFSTEAIDLYKNQIIWARKYTGETGDSLVKLGTDYVQNAVTFEEAEERVRIAAKDTGGTMEKSISAVLAGMDRAPAKGMTDVLSDMQKSWEDQSRINKYVEDYGDEIERLGVRLADVGSLTPEEWERLGPAIEESIEAGVPEDVPKRLAAVASKWREYVESAAPSEEHLRKYVEGEQRLEAWDDILKRIAKDFYETGALTKDQNKTLDDIGKTAFFRGIPGAPMKIMTSEIDRLTGAEFGRFKEHAVEYEKAQTAAGKYSKQITTLGYAFAKAGGDVSPEKWNEINKAMDEASAAGAPDPSKWFFAGMDEFKKDVDAGTVSLKVFFKSILKNGMMMSWFGYRLKNMGAVFMRWGLMPFKMAVNALSNWEKAIDSAASAMGGLAFAGQDTGGRMEFLSNSMLDALERGYRFQGAMAYAQSTLSSLLRDVGTPLTNAFYAFGDAIRNIPEDQLAKLRIAFARVASMIITLMPSVIKFIADFAVGFVTGINNTIKFASNLLTKLSPVFDFLRGLFGEFGNGAKILGMFAGVLAGLSIGMSVLGTTMFFVGPILKLLNSRLIQLAISNMSATVATQRNTYAQGGLTLIFTNLLGTIQMAIVKLLGWVHAQGLALKVASLSTQSMALLAGGVLLAGAAYIYFRKQQKKAMDEAGKQTKSLTDDLEFFGGNVSSSIRDLVVQTQLGTFAIQENGDAVNQMTGEVIGSYQELTDEHGTLVRQIVDGNGDVIYTFDDVNQSVIDSSGNMVGTLIDDGAKFTLWKEEIVGAIDTATGRISGFFGDMDVRVDQYGNIIDQNTEKVVGFYEETSGAVYNFVDQTTSYVKEAQSSIGGVSDAVETLNAAIAGMSFNIDSSGFTAGMDEMSSSMAEMMKHQLAIMAITTGFKTGHPAGILAGLGIAAYLEKELLGELYDKLLDLVGIEPASGEYLPATSIEQAAMDLYDAFARFEKTQEYKNLGSNIKDQFDIINYEFLTGGRNAEEYIAIMERWMEVHNIMFAHSIGEDVQKQMNISSDAMREATTAAGDLTQGWKALYEMAMQRPDELQGLVEQKNIGALEAVMAQQATAFAKITDQATAGGIGYGIGYEMELAAQAFEQGRITAYEFLQVLRALHEQSLELNTEEYEKANTILGGLGTSIETTAGKMTPKDLVSDDTSVVLGSVSELLDTIGIHIQEVADGWQISGEEYGKAYSTFTGALVDPKGVGISEGAPDWALVMYQQWDKLAARYGYILTEEAERTRYMKDQYDMMENFEPLLPAAPENLRTEATPNQNITITSTVSIGNVTADVDMAEIEDAVNSGLSEALRRRLW